MKGIKTNVVWVVKRPDINENFGIFSTYPNAEEFVKSVNDTYLKDKLVIVEVELDREVSF